MHRGHSQLLAAAGLAALSCGTSERSVGSPPLAIGADAYLDFGHMYRPKLGVRSWLRSTCDRSGGNEAADSGHFLRAEADDFFVTLDVAGPGVLYFVRTNRWHGSPWSYVVDGQRFTVSESATANPLAPPMSSVFLPEDAFPSPLTYTWNETRGADLSWVPIMFKDRLTLAYGRTFYGTGYYIYQQLPRSAAGLSRPLASFAAAKPEAALLELLAKAGSDIGEDSAFAQRGQTSLSLGANESRAVAELTGPRRLVALKLTAAADQALALEQASLRIFWDDEREASVDAPLPLFFGTGTLYSRAQTEWLVKGLLFGVRSIDGQLELTSYFPMPFLRNARIELQAGALPLSAAKVELRSEPLSDPPEWVGHFHATYRDHGVPTLGRDLVLLDTRAKPSCGSIVGTSFTFTDRAELSTLEGDPRFFFDDAESPQGYGTGTEEWAGGGDYWGGQTMSLPLAGHPTGAPSLAQAHNARDAVHSAYRILIADALPFGKNARMQLEHGADNLSLEHYRTLVYWYGRPSACLIATDSLHVGDLTDERAHDYQSATASEVETIRSRFELGPDYLGAIELNPESTDTGRHMHGTSELTLRIDPQNRGVLLRRKLDYSWPNQRAHVFVADPLHPQTWQPAGEWYLAGSTLSVFASPMGELDRPSPVLQRSTRRFREDEFLIPAELTQGLDTLRIRIEFVPDPTPVLPSEEAPETAWSELRYTAYSWVL